MLAHYELSKLRLPHGSRLEGAPGLAAQFFLTIDVAEGPYTPATLTFWIKVFDEYPERGSFSARCTKRVFHPCVEPTTGQIGFSDEQLGLDSGAPLRLQSIIHGIRQMVVTPVDSPAMNSEAAFMFHNDPDEFRRTVRLSLAGGEHGGIRFDRVLRAPGKTVREGPPSPGSAPASDKAVPEKVKMDMMHIEVMRDRIGSQVDSWVRDNTNEIEALETTSR